MHGSDAKCDSGWLISSSVLVFLGEHSLSSFYMDRVHGQYKNSVHQFPLYSNFFTHQPIHLYMPPWLAQERGNYKPYWSIIKPQSSNLGLFYTASLNGMLVVNF
ncbi:hypothetical protein HPP92_027025 [Vanilla planifolia]|uniref:Uncharacterized protein n=1 Tax=Vanilla planifolia TaxID=51239 RepID=A0A835PEU2_VANPL|nr:hypothetical protein HPP92_027025 [Vanilla planifolia]